jgi:hypothetical protein
VGQAILPADSLSAGPAACKAACFFQPVTPAISAMSLQLLTAAALKVASFRAATVRERSSHGGAGHRFLCPAKPLRIGA